jgi:hypothetical protein
VDNNYLCGSGKKEKPETESAINGLRQPFLCLQKVDRSLCNFDQTINENENLSSLNTRKLIWTIF